MKNDLSCAVVRDLLPSYTEGLTEPETTQTVAAHLNTCPDCAARYRAMASSQGDFSTEAAKEVDYLKQVRKKSRKTAVRAVLLVLLAVLAAGWAKLFLIGTPMEGGYTNAVYNEGDNTLSLQMYNPNSGTALIRIMPDTADGVMTITGREVLVSFLHPNPAESRMDIPLEGLNKIVAFGRTVWQDGIIVNDITGQLFNAKTPYVGDPSAFTAADGVSGILHLYHFLPAVDHTHELQTKEEPYGWTMVYEEGSSLWDEQMERSGVMALALIGNLGEFSWRWADSPQLHTVTLEEANKALPTLVDNYNAIHGTHWTALPSVKDYAATPAALQQLFSVLEMRPLY